MSKNLYQFRIGGQNKVSADTSKAPGKISAVKAEPRILTVGMHLTKTRGGITTLIAEILKSPLKNEFEFVYIESQAEDFGGFRKLLLAMQAVFKFIRICLFTRIDTVYVHLGSNASLYRESVFIFLAKIFRKKVVAHFHAGDIDNYYPFQSRIGRQYIRAAIRASDIIIAVSNESARQLREITDAPHIAVVPNAIDVSAFNHSPEKRCDDGAVRLLFVGAVGKLKGERDLLKALAILRVDKSNLKVSLLGYGAENLQSYCEQLKIENYIEFAGAVSMDERIGYFRAADIFVLPTYAEAMPMSVIEAMAAGLPVISTTVGGIPEMIADGTDGFLIAPGDVNALAEKISFLIENENVRLEVGKRARKKAVEQMDFRQYADKLRVHLLNHHK